MLRTRTSKPNAPRSTKTPAFVCPVRESNSFNRQGLFAIHPSLTSRFGQMEGGPLKR